MLCEIDKIVIFLLYKDLKKLIICKYDFGLSVEVGLFIISKGLLSKVVIVNMICWCWLFDILFICLL